MNLLKKIIYWKLSLQFFLITNFRNKLYDLGLIKSHIFKIPVISVGNIAVGGTGKTPMIEFLIRKFSPNYNVGVLSRGYKRNSKGFILASDLENAKSIGDEPFQYFTKFKNIKVAVDKKRKRGIKKLDFLPSAKTSPNGRPKSNAPATILIVRQNPTKR